MSVPTDLYTYCLTLSLHDALPISAQRVARDVGALAVGDRVPGAVVVVAVIVQPHRDHAQGAGDQLSRARALVAVPGHPFHRAVQAVGEPVAQVLLVLAQLDARDTAALEARSEEHTSELQSLMRISYAVFCLKKKKNNQTR